MTGRSRFALSLLAGVLLTGCSRGTPANAPSASSEQHTAAANLRVTDAIALAQVHLKHREFQDAEKVLLKALEEASAATNKAEAIALLSQVKAAKASGAASASPPAGDVAAAPPGEASSASSSTDAADRIPAEAGVQSASAPTAEQTAAAQQEVTPDTAEVVEIASNDSDVEVEGEKTPATDVEIRRILKEAGTKETATEAMKLLERFARHHTFSADQDIEFQRELGALEDRIKKGLVRNGHEWIPPADYKAAMDEADALVERAFELIRLGNAQASVELLEKASRLDRNGIRADFVLGTIYTVVSGAAGLDLAEHHFQEVLRRQPNHISAMNNLAVTLVKKRDYDQALRHWRRAMELAPKTPAVSQNLGRVVTAASGRKLAMAPSLLRRFSDTYAELTASGKGPQADPHTGWLIMPLYLATSEQERHGADASGSLVDIGSGSGFVVAAGYVLTNRHVVRDEAFGDHDAYAIIAAGNVNKEYDAKLIAVSADDDLAILHCPGLELPIVPFEADALPRGSEVLILGYPQPGVLGMGLKATQGIVTALPEASNENMVLFDATANPGNSGGPVLTRRGGVAAVLTAIFLTEQGYSAGVPSPTAIEFVRKVLPDWEPEHAPDGRLEWADVDSRVGPSTVRIICRRQEIGVAIGGSEQSASGYLEDRSCCVCGGSAIVSCPANGCSNGVVSVPQRAQVGYSPLTGPIYGTKVFKDTCSTCSGKGIVECPYCSGGIDPDVR